MITIADKLKLFAAFLVLSAGIGGFYFLGGQSELLRVGVLLVALVGAIVIAMQEEGER